MKKTLAILFLSTFALSAFAADQVVAPQASKNDSSAPVKKFKKKKKGKKGHKKAKKQDAAPAENAAPAAEAPAGGGAAPTNP